MWTICVPMRDWPSLADDFGSAYGDAVFHDKQSALIASYGAPLVHVDFRCVDAMGDIGGYGNGVLGNSAKCNLDDVTQIDDSNGLIGSHLLQILAHLVVVNRWAAGPFGARPPIGRSGGLGAVYRSARIDASRWEYGADQPL
jgi:hypothetical protein